MLEFSAMPEARLHRAWRFSDFVRTIFCYENKSSLSCSCFDRYLIAETSQLPRETLRFAKAFRLRQWRAGWLLIRLSALVKKEKRALQAVSDGNDQPLGFSAPVEAVVFVC